MSSTQTEGAERRDRGIQAAAHHAGQGWNEEADAFLAQFIEATTGPFLCEDVRVQAEAHGLPSPPSKRAWGGVMRRAAQSGAIRRQGYAPVENPKAHRTPATVWQTTA